MEHSVSPRGSRAYGAEAEEFDLEQQLAAAEAKCLRLKRLIEELEERLD